MLCLNINDEWSSSVRLHVYFISQPGAELCAGADDACSSSSEILLLHKPAPFLPAFSSPQHDYLCTEANVEMRILASSGHCGFLRLQRSIPHSSWDRSMACCFAPRRGLRSTHGCRKHAVKACGQATMNFLLLVLVPCNESQEN